MMAQLICNVEICKVQNWADNRNWTMVTVIEGQSLSIFVVTYSYVGIYKTFLPHYTLGLSFQQKKFVISAFFFQFLVLCIRIISLFNVHYHFFLDIYHYTHNMSKIDFYKCSIFFPLLIVSFQLPRTCRYGNLF